MLGGSAAVTRAEYHASQPWGLSTCIDIFDCDPEILRDRARIEAFTRALCDLLGVRRFGDPLIVRFGEDPAVFGYSMVQLIETSLVSAHFVEHSNAVYLDVFSCKWYDAEVAVEFARTFFQGKRVQMQQCLRC
jgi:S-adenosylmethionine decarboxylase